MRRRGTALFKKSQRDKATLFRVALVNKLENNKALPQFLDAYKKALARWETDLTQAEQEQADRQRNQQKLIRREQFAQLAQEEAQLQADRSNQPSVGYNAETDAAYDSRAQAPAILEAYQPSSIDHILRVLSRRIGLRFAESAQRYYLSPVLHRLTEAGTSQLFKGIHKAVEKSNRVYLEGLYSKHYTGKELSSRCNQEELGITPLTAEQSEAVLGKLPFAARTFLQDLREQKALTIDHLYVLAGAYGLRIKLYDQQGRFLLSAGHSKHAQKTLVVVYGKGAETGKGHYAPYDPILRSKVVPTGPDSCLLDTIAVHMDDPSDFLDATKREQRLLAHINANWETYQQFFQATSVLQQNHQERFLYEGGAVFLVPIILGAIKIGATVYTLYQGYEFVEKVATDAEFLEKLSQGEYLAAGQQAATHLPYINNIKEGYLAFEKKAYLAALRQAKDPVVDIILTYAGFKVIEKGGKILIKVTPKAIKALKKLHQGEGKFFRKWQNTRRAIAAPSLPVKTLPGTYEKILLRNRQGKAIGAKYTQKHHIIHQQFSDHELVKAAGFDVNDKKNIILLPTKEGKEVYTTIRAVHQGRHSNKAVEDLRKMLNKELEKGQSLGYTQEQYRTAVDKIIKDEQHALRKGIRDLYEKTPMPPKN